MRQYVGLLRSMAVLSVVLMTATHSSAAQSMGSGPTLGSAEPKGLDERFVDIAALVPEFGGMFLDGAGNPTVFLLDPSKKSDAEAAIAAAFGHDRVRPSSIRVLQGRFAFLDLKSWHDRMVDVLGLPGVSLTDIDEANNRLTIGLERMNVLSMVEERLADLGIPRDAVNIEETGPIEFATHTLRDRVRPLVGGLQVAFNCTSTACSVCTDGFGACRYVGLTYVCGFVTNSHCTLRQGGVEGTTYWQPITSTVSNNRVAIERLDPTYFTGGSCPLGRRCRYSGSSLAGLDSTVPGGVSIRRGWIARPTGFGALAIDHNRPKFRIVGEQSTPLVGEVVGKVGRTTGWTQGSVISTCSNSNVAGTDITLLCQDRVRAASAGGDSGSPVFRLTNSPAVWRRPALRNPVGKEHRRDAVRLQSHCEHSAKWRVGEPGKL